MNSLLGFHNCRLLARSLVRWSQTSYTQPKPVSFIERHPTKNCTTVPRHGIARSFGVPSAAFRLPLASQAMPLPPPPWRFMSTHAHRQTTTGTATKATTTTSSRCHRYITKTNAFVSYIICTRAFGSSNSWSDDVARHRLAYPFVVRIVFFFFSVKRLERYETKIQKIYAR